MIKPQSTPRASARATILQLAKQHQIEHHHSRLDELGGVISRLSDNEVELDKIQWLLVELNRAGILTGIDNSMLHLQYLRERKS